MIRLYSVKQTFKMKKMESMKSSENIQNICGCNIFNLAKILTGIEIILSIIVFIIVLILMAVSFFIPSPPANEYSKVIGGFLIIWTILILEYVGINRKNNGIIIFNLVIRVILTVLIVIGFSIFVLLAIMWYDTFTNLTFSLGWIVLLTLFPLSIYGLFRTYLQFKVYDVLKELPILKRIEDVMEMVRIKILEREMIGTLRN